MSNISEEVHGTHAGYVREFNRGKQPCDACKAGHAAYMRRLRAAGRTGTGKPKAKVAACGTPSGYHRHRRLGEQPCDACRSASRESARQWREQNPDASRRIRTRHSAARQLATNRGSVILCQPRTDCADPNVNRWHCMRGHKLDDQKAIPGVCLLTVCERRGARFPTQWAQELAEAKRELDQGSA